MAAPLGLWLPRRVSWGRPYWAWGPLRRNPAIRFPLSGLSWVGGDPRVAKPGSGALPTETLRRVTVWRVGEP